ncbi:MAG: C2H2-type zinc finger protein, partial [Ignisphaera sp.]
LYYCRYCDRIFYTRGLLRRHMHLHRYDAADAADDYDDDEGKEEGRGAEDEGKERRSRSRSRSGRRSYQLLSLTTYFAPAL